METLFLNDTGLIFLNENHLIELAREGDLPAFNQLVLAYQDAAFRVANWMLNDPAGAEDIVQTAFLSIYRKLDHFRNISFRGWLLKTVRNACIDELRKRKRHTWTALDPHGDDGEELESARWLMDPGMSPEEALIQREGWAAIQSCLARLPGPMQEVIILIDIEELDYREASQVLGIPLGTVKSRLGRARAALREALREAQLERE